MRDERDFTKFGWATGARELRIGVGNVGSGTTLLSLLRLIVMTPMELEGVVGEDDEGGTEDDELEPAGGLVRDPISLRNEVSAMKLLHAVVDQHLEKFPNSLEFDLALIATGTLQDGTEISENQLNGLRIVVGEKRVLEHLKAISLMALKYLDAARSSFNGGLYYPVFLETLLQAPSGLKTEDVSMFDPSDFFD